ncbi:transposable element Tcb2 transposase [Trichonephila clavipes]|nr:transposable element Tcb2 transposase [Trichonephila clavipes]
MPLRRFRRQYEQLSHFERMRIIGMMEAGWSARRVARPLGRSDCVVRRCWDQGIRKMSFTRRPGSGHPRPTSRRENRHIVRNAHVQPTVSSAAIQAQQHTTPTAGVMVWDAIAYKTRSPLVLIRGTMTAQRNVHDILQPHVLQLMQRLPGAIFQPDNSQPHTARVSQACLRTVTTLPWPARSPDLSAIKHIWDHLDNKHIFSSYSCPVFLVLFVIPTAPGKFFRPCIPVVSCQVIYSQFGLAIHQNDHQGRRRFVEWAQNEIAVVPDFHKRILFSDEAHFWLNGYVNKQNFRMWSEAIPQVYVETPLHPEKLTVWCALWAGGILLQKR